MYDPDAGVHGGVYLTGDIDANASRLGRQKRENGMAVILLTNTRGFGVSVEMGHTNDRFSPLSLSSISFLFTATPGNQTHRLVGKR